MTDQWVVLLNTGDSVTAYGPIGNGAEAGAFAQWLTQTVDPAIRVPLHSPAAEMLAWWSSEMARNNCTHDGDCPVHPGRSEAWHLLHREEIKENRT